MITYISSYEELVNKLPLYNEVNYKIVINYYTVHNIGVELLNKITTNLAVKNKIILDCGESLSYLLYAIEKGFKTLISTSKHKDVLSTIKDECQILLFTSYEELVNYFN